MLSTKWKGVKRISLRLLDVMTKQHMEDLVVQTPPIKLSCLGPPPLLACAPLVVQACALRCFTTDDAASSSRDHAVWLSLVSMPVTLTTSRGSRGHSHCGAAEGLTVLRGAELCLPLSACAKPGLAVSKVSMRKETADAVSASRNGR